VALSFNVAVALTPPALIVILRIELLLLQGYTRIAE
jgi:hypothetical protein